MSGPGSVFRGREAQAKRAVSQVDFELLCERYGKQFAVRLREYFGSEILGKELTRLTPEELAELRPKLTESTEYKRILKEISEEFGKAMRSFGATKLPAGQTSADAVAKIILYSERSMMRDTLIVAKFETQWRNAATGIKGIMSARMEELKAEREGFARRGSPVPTELKNKIARYAQLTKNEAKFTELLRDSFTKAGNMREFFENVFSFDPHHVGFLNRDKAKQMLIGLGDNSLDLGINKLAFQKEFNFVGELSIRMKVIPKVLLSGCSKGTALQKELAAGVIEQIIEAHGGSASIMRAVEKARADSAKSLLVFFAPNKVVAEKAASKAIQFDAKKTAFLWTGDITRSLAKEGGRVGMIALAAFSTYLLLEGMGGSSGSTNAQTVPIKVK